MRRNELVHRLAAVSGLAIFLSYSCTHVAVRDATVYTAEIDLFERIALDESTLLLEEARKAKWARCMDLAEPALVAKHRAPFHAAKALHLAGLGEDPGEAPEIPDAKTVCGEPTINDVSVEPGDHDHLVIE